jgi:hypothetical protein
MFGKQKRRPIGSRKSSAVRDAEGALKRDKLFAGQRVFVDHFVCSTNGRLRTSRGATLEKDMYKGGVIFVDAATKFIHVEPLVHLNTHETLAAVQKFEALLQDFGVVVQEYRSDQGGAFTSKGFAEKLRVFGQIQSFAGIGAHHQSAAERAIQTIMSMARTSMLHHAIHWPDVSDATLWPYSVAYSVFIHNHVPEIGTGISPHDLLSRTRWPVSGLHHLQVWGAPTYLLDKKMQDGKKLPRWKPRSRRTMFVGLSDMHASMVPLVLDLMSKAITAQYHVLFDSRFSTISVDVDHEINPLTPPWSNLFGESEFQFVFDPDDPAEFTDAIPPAAAAHDDPMDPLTAQHRQLIEERMNGPPLPFPLAPYLPKRPRTKSPPAAAVQPQRTATVTFIDEQPGSSLQTPVQREKGLGSNPAQEPAPVQEIQPNSPASAPTAAIETPATPENPAPVQPTPKTPPPESSPASTTPPPPILRRSGRERRPATKLSYDTLGGTPGSSPAPPIGQKPPKMSAGFYSHVAALSAQFDSTSHEHHAATYLNGVAANAARVDQLRMDAAIAASLDLSLNGIQSPEFYAANGRKKANPDLPTVDEVMADPDPIVRAAWVQSMQNEITELEKKGTWEECDQSEATSRIVPLQWALRIKRFPDGREKKKKSRIVVRGDLQEGVVDSFAPVVDWASIRLFFFICLMFGFYTEGVDFNNAFCQSYLKKDEKIWVHLPRGFRSAYTDGTKKCLRLLRSLYGLKSAPKTFFNFLMSGLLDMGFKRCKNDPCLLYKKDMICVVYCDDILFGFRNPADFDAVFDELRRRGYDLDRDGNAAEYLGLYLTRDTKNNSLSLTQTGLIDRVLKLTGMTDCNPNHVPAAPKGLGTDPDGKPYDEPWEYASVVGILQYLAANTRPDISFAVSQVSRHTHHPKVSHATAVKTILRYLKKTKLMGLVLSPDGTLNLDCFCDADFAGLFGVELQDNPNSARSRLGFVITIGGCPLLWKSKLIREICLSTQHSEYTSLSAAMRELIPLRSIVDEIRGALSLPLPETARAHSRVFEDNQACLQLATTHRLTSRNRFYNCRLHHFWSFVRSGDLSIEAVSTTDQLADLFTKGLTRQPFEYLRKKLMGW